MATDLSQFVWSHTLVDTHEHMLKEQDWLTTGPDDVLQDLFGNYVPADLISAGATQEAMKRASDGKDPDVAGRFAGIENAWNAIRHTGYGEAVQLIAERVYGIAEITPEACSAAAPRLQALRSPGQRLAMLQESAGLDHIQTDDFVWACLPDESGPEFFLYDLSWVNFCSGNLDVEKIAGETGVTIRDLPTLNEAMEALFHRYGPLAIAVKAQHAYNRTLLWQERSPADAERALQISLTDPNGRDEATRLCLGDWCWARGVELAIEYNLPFKIHTG
ncbi:MAG: hypothetical protein FJX77_04640, partial [Armatimonadetes bacterium]|nr:hypothetical protein [Armatimonadota bacterium]